MKDCYLICGIQGSGKTWVCKQLTDKFHYVPHDEHFKDQVFVVWNACRTSDKPVITECPFGERIVKIAMEEVGIRVRPYFVITPIHTIFQQYNAREGKLPELKHMKAMETRSASIIPRAIDWGAPYGSSDHILGLLKALKNS